jgi:hypothetical protein
MPGELAGDQAMVVLLYEYVRVGLLPDDHASLLKEATPD